MEKTIGETMEVFTIEQIKLQLQQYFYWQMEQEEDLITGEICSLQPNLFMVDRIHKIISLTTQLKVLVPDWKNIVDEAKERAKKQRLEEAKKELDEQ